MRRAAIATSFVLAIAALEACGSLGSGALDVDTGDGGTSPKPGDGAPTPPSAQDGRGDLAQGTGVVVVHAARFGAFRLCFQNYPDLEPQPDAKAMPEANVVGLDVGTAVRLDPLASAPGEVYVIDERAVRTTVGSRGVKCRDRICAGGAKCIRENIDYFKTPPVNEGVGATAVSVLAITGCPNRLTPGASPATCGASWQPETGNFVARAFALRGASTAGGGTPFQLVHLASDLERRRGAGEVLSITFGPLGGAHKTELARDPKIDAVTDPRPILLDGSEPSYARDGFRVSVVAGDGGADASFSTESSLAQIQKMSSPRSVAPDYYTAGASYALVLLGDPAESEKGDAGDPFRAVHMLAVPVVEPSDGGADGGAGTGSTLDGGSR